MPAKNGRLGFLLKLVIVLAVLGGAGFLAFQNFTDTAIVEAVRRTKAVDIVTGSVTVNADGGIRPLKSEAPGRVVKCDALDEDKIFKEGDVLLELDTSEIDRAIQTAVDDYNALVARAKLQREKDPALRLAKDQLETVKRLHAKNEKSYKELEAAQVAVQNIETLLALGDLDAKKAETSFNAAKAQSDSLKKKMTILAPFDGSVQTPVTFTGAIVNAGDTVAMILSDKRVVTAKVSEDNIAKVKVDQLAKVTLLIYPGEQFDAKVLRISETADESQRFNVFLEVKATPARLKHGSTGEARITVGERENSPVIARRAVFNDNQVYVVKAGRVELRTVEIGFRAMNKVEVLSGLEPGELVIVDKTDEFYPGQRVRLPKPSEKK